MTASLFVGICAVLLVSAVQGFSEAAGRRCFQMTNCTECSDGLVTSAPAKCCTFCPGQANGCDAGQRWYEHGDILNSGCRTCKCQNRKLSCVNVCNKPGKCPAADTVQASNETCNAPVCVKDDVCPGSSKCCANDCGTKECTQPVFEGCPYRKVVVPHARVILKKRNLCKCNNGNFKCVDIFARIRG